MPSNEQPIFPLSTPFNNIALSLSGGGFRAAGYSLGIMSYMDRLTLPGETKARTFLENVTFISSASGGTITNALYGMFLHRGKTFRDFYLFLLEKIKGEKLLNAVLEKLNNDKEWDPPGTGKTRNLINAFAKVYDEQLFAGETFSVFSDHQHAKRLSVCFNTTEFYRGLSFRFQTDGENKTSEYIGNRYVRFDKKDDIYKRTKLADILAASSCFPAGFEPIIFPNDFVYTTSQKGISLTLGELKDSMILEEYDSSVNLLQNPVAFMDGGITDNQALQSAMLADERNSNHKNAFDLIIIGDVTSHFMNAFKPAVEKKREGWRNLTINGILSILSGVGKQVDKWLRVSVIAFLASVAIVILGHTVLHPPFVRYAGYFLTGIMLIIVFLLAIASRLKKRHPLLRRFFGGSAMPDINMILQDVDFGNTFSKDIIAKLIAYLGNTKLSVLEQMIRARGTSVLAMTMDINLKHTRRLIYQLFFDNKKWTDRRLYNVSFELSEFNKANRYYRIEKKLNWASKEDKKILNDVTPQLQAIADDARTMGTTLWFGGEDVKKDKLKKVVSCGQFTTCMNLIEYVLCIERKVERQELILDQRELDKLGMVKKQLLEDWEKFKLDPYFLYDAYAT